jgi:ATP adenylyltransferase
MEQLWAPWRMTYVAAGRPRSGEQTCFLCHGLAESADRQNLIAWRTPLSVVALNLFPYNNGHLLVAPQAHKARLDELADEEHLDLMRTIQRMVQVLDDLMRPDAYNIGINLGKAAGAGLPGHLHWHVVPRWDGDTNFMPVLADVKVIVQSLETLYDLLREKLQPSA